MIFTAKVVTGQEAHDIGLVEQVVPANEEGNAAYLKALEIAQEITTKVEHDCSYYYSIYYVYYTALVMCIRPCLCTLNCVLLYRQIELKH